MRTGILGGQHERAPDRPHRRIAPPRRLAHRPHRYGRRKPRLAGKRMLWLGLAGAADGDDFSVWMAETLDRVLREGISFYNGITDSAVEVLHDAEGEPQIVDADGNFTKGEALSGDARAAHYEAFDRKAVEHAERFLGLE
ncbi:MAG TPA: hypothetical protein VHG10_02420 [Glycomyces sp.]|nr:hypothetical protein [Glycomyces sp.]